MNRRSLLQLAGAALVSGAPALRAYSFLTNNPLAKRVMFTGRIYGSSVNGHELFYTGDMHPNGDGFDLGLGLGSTPPPERAFTTKSSET